MLSVRKHLKGKLRAIWLGLTVVVVAALYAAAIKLPVYAEDQQPDLSVHQAVANYSSLPMGATSAPAGVAQQGYLLWNPFFTNQSQAPITNVSVTVNSGQDASLFSWGDLNPLPSFPQTKTVATIEPGQQFEPNTIGSDVQTNQAPGYDSTRTVSPAAIPAGGGQQTVTITFRPVDPRYAPNLGVTANIIVDSQIPGVTVASVTNPTNLDQGEVLNPIDSPNGLYQWQIGMLQLNKEYTFKAVLNVPNSNSAPLNYQPRVGIRDEHAQEVYNNYTGTSVTVPEPTLDGNVAGSGSITYSVAEGNHTWQVKRSEAYDIVYPGTEPAPVPMAVNLIVNPGTGTPGLVVPSLGLVVVAVPSTNDLDASMVGRVKFGVIGTEASPLWQTMLDINHDGRKDLVMIFSTKQAGIVCGTKHVVLTGKFAMTDVRGEADIRTLGR